MTLKVREVNFIADRDELLGVLRENLPTVRHEERFTWLYLENPAGPARSWFLCDEAGTAVGVTSLFPRSVWLGAANTTCGQVGDFAVNSRFRSLGPAITLQRSTFEPVFRGDMAFCYDCPPHELGMAMFQRLGLRESCRMRFYVKLLRTERQLERFVGKSIARVAGPIANLLLGLPSQLARSSQIDINLHQGEFTDEFSALDVSPKDDEVRNRRRAEDLNWRFRHNPLQQFKVLTARRNGELLAYLIFCVAEQDAFIYDLFGRTLDQTAPALLHELVNTLRRDSIQTVRALLSAEGELSTLFLRAGFSVRGDGPRIVAFAKAGGDSMQSARWDFQHADVMA